MYERKITEQSPEGNGTREEEGRGKDRRKGLVFILLEFFSREEGVVNTQ